MFFSPSAARLGARLTLPVPSPPLPSSAGSRSAQLQDSSEEEEGEQGGGRSQPPPGRPSKAGLSSRATSNRNKSLCGAVGGRWMSPAPLSAHGGENSIPRPVPPRVMAAGSWIRSGVRAQQEPSRPAPFRRRGTGLSTPAPPPLAPWDGVRCWGGCWHPGTAAAASQVLDWPQGAPSRGPSPAPAGPRSSC